MKNLKQADIISIIQPYIPFIRNCMISAIEKYAQIFLPLNHVLEIRTRANCIHDFIAEAIRLQFGCNQYEDVGIIEVKGLFLLEFQNQIYLRFNKFYPNLMPARSNTLQNIAYFGQMALFEECGRKINLTAGYIIDNFWESLTDLYICYPLKNKNLWSISIMESSTKLIFEEVYENFNQQQSISEKPGRVQVITTLRSVMKNDTNQS